MNFSKLKLIKTRKTNESGGSGVRAVIVVILIDCNHYTKEVRWDVSYLKREVTAVRKVTELAKVVCKKTFDAKSRGLSVHIGFLRKVNYISQNSKMRRRRKKL